MNCLMQKALKDNVFVNKCVLNSVLWFPIECPKWHSKFDDPVEFKLKFKKFIAETKSAAHFSFSFMDERDAKLMKEFNFTPYPEDIKTFKDAKEFTDEFKQHDPLLHPPKDDDEFEPDPFLWGETPKHLRPELGKIEWYPQNPDIEQKDTDIWKF